MYVVLKIKFFENYFSQCIIDNNSLKLFLGSVPFKMNSQLRLHSPHVHPKAFWPMVDTLSLSTNHLWPVYCYHITANNG